MGYAASSSTSPSGSRLTVVNSLEKLDVEQNLALFVRSNLSYLYYSMIRQKFVLREIGLGV